MVGDVRSRQEVAGSGAGFLVAVFGAGHHHVVDGELARCCQRQERAPAPDLNVIRMRTETHDRQWSARKADVDHEVAVARR